jgi:3',5'-cyclic AMP phosphodiesterase CpdA
MRIVQISDLHFWHVTLNPRRLASKRFLGMANLVLNRARKYRMETMGAVVDRIRALGPDHVLVTGDLTTTSLEEEFAACRAQLDALSPTAATFTVIPGNHDRYTRDAARGRVFERYFGDCAPAAEYPWLKPLAEGTAVLGLDPTRPNPISAEGVVSREQLERAAALLDQARPERLIVACHYPVALPVGIVERRGHGLRGVAMLQEFLNRYGPSLYCHGHVHTAWAFTPQSLPATLCVDSGAALRRRRAPGVTASLVEIVLAGTDVEVRRHRLRTGGWEAETLAAVPAFFDRPPRLLADGRP